MHDGRDFIDESFNDNSLPVLVSNLSHMANVKHDVHVNHIILL